MNLKLFNGLVAVVAIALSIVAPHAQATQPDTGGFIDYDYIESPGTAYIDTGYVPNSKTELEMKFSFTTNLATKTYVFGVYGTNGGRLQFSYGPENCFFGHGGNNDYDNAVTGLSYNMSNHVIK